MRRSSDHHLVDTAPAPLRSIAVKAAAICVAVAAAVLLECTALMLGFAIASW